MPVPPAIAAAAAAGPGSDGASAAMPLITLDDEDRFEVHGPALDYLRSLTGKIAVVTIAGKLSVARRRSRRSEEARTFNNIFRLPMPLLGPGMYRTGKSYLLNALMGVRSGSSASGGGGGFGVGSTVRAHTKGLWVWGRAVEVDGSDTHVLFLDTEGLGSTVRSESYDSRIFALALLLSSYFIYNSQGTVDGAAIAKLSLVVNLTRHIHVRSAAAGKEDSGTEFGQFFPAFLWVVRDFSVKLERDGRKISAREYLEDALRPEDGVSEAVEQKNAVRMLIRNFFPERDCACWRARRRRG